MYICTSINPPICRLNCRKYNWEITIPRSTGLIAVAYGDVHLLVRLAIILVLAVAAILRKMSFFATHITCSDLFILLRFLLEVSDFLSLSTIVHLTLSLTLAGGLVHYDVSTLLVSLMLSLNRYSTSAQNSPV